MGEVVLVGRRVSRQFFRKGRTAARYFDAVVACDVELRSGEVVVLTGRSGSGKSTLLNLLAGLLEPTEGSVEFAGQSLYQLDDAALSQVRNGSFGIVPQGQTALHSLTVIENVMLPLEFYHTRNDESSGLELLEKVGIAELADSYPSELSGGELRRVAIARALACDPSVVFADEPTSDLDDENTETVLDLFREIADRGAAVLMVTHDRAAERIADRIWRMDAGVLKED